MRRSLSKIPESQFIHEGKAIFLDFSFLDNNFSVITSSNSESENLVAVLLFDLLVLGELVF